MSEAEEKRSKEREKIEAEIARSLSVVKMKETHKQIEDIEKLRKQASIKSACERISFCLGMVSAMVESFALSKKEIPSYDKLDIRNIHVKKYLKNAVALYESIRFDLQRGLDVRKEDFDRLFPELELNFDTYESVIPNLDSMSIQLVDMRNYCLRSL